ncbi:hypothetical protein P2318_02490 [Myxococcaceae bacterium GXIMD 01537]
MNLLKTILAFLFAGAWLGGAVASWAGPSMLEWYNTQSAEFGTQTVCNVPHIIRLVTGKLISYQLIGSGIGAAAGLILAVLLARALARRRAAKQPSEPTAAA